jgi:hypothetical protein
MSEEQIWSCTPRKFFALLECAMEYAEAKHGGTKSTKKQKHVPTRCIDEINL